MQMTPDQSKSLYRDVRRLHGDDRTDVQLYTTGAHDTVNAAETAGVVAYFVGTIASGDLTWACNLDRYTLLDNAIK
jgi:hypothetical protein